MPGSHFGLRQRPFRALPDTATYYPATTHEAALQAIQTGLDDQESILLLTADAGMGKTLLGQRLLETAPASTRPLLLTGSLGRSRMDLLQSILFDLGLPYCGLSEQEMRLTVLQTSLDHFSSGGKTLLLIDEAQHLTWEQLEEIRLLSNLEGRHGKALQIVLLGLMDLLATLQQPELRSFRQRIAVRAYLEALDVHEAGDFLLHQIRAAGGDPHSLIDAEAIAILVQFAHGIPRLLNQAGRVALRTASFSGSDRIDAEVAVEAVRQLQAIPGRSEVLPPPRPQPIVGSNDASESRRIALLNAAQALSIPRNPFDTVYSD